MSILIRIMLFFTGASLGSFINVLVLRMERGKKFVLERSECLYCGHKLSYLDTIPLISSLLIGGKCRYCGKHISIRYPVTEVIGGAVALFTYLRYDLSCEGMTVAVILLNLLAVALFDLDTMTIPDSYIISLVILTILHMITGNVSAFERLAGALIISIPMLLIIITVKGFGVGDLYISVLCGLCFGYKVMLIGFLLGLIIGSGKAVYMIAVKKRKGSDMMPFAPSLCIGIAVAVFYSDMIMNTYTALMH